MYVMFTYVMLLRLTISHLNALSASTSISKGMQHEQVEYHDYVVIYLMLHD